MRFFKPFFFVLLILQPLSADTIQAQDLAAWVVRFDIDSREKVAAICSQAQQNHFDRLLVQVRGRADAYYQSDLVPRAEGLVPGFDPLAAVLSQCENVEIDAWLNVYYLWTGDTPPEDERHPALNRSWLLKDGEGRRVDTYSALEQSQRWIEGIYADPASESYRRYFSAAVVELVQNYPVRGIHLDFARYPGSFFGAGDRLAEEFEKKYGLAVNELPEKLSRQDFSAWLNGSLPPEQQRRIVTRLIWDYWRAAEVSKLVAMVRSELLATRPGIRLSVSVFPDPVEAFLDKGQDWPEWLRSGMVDELFVMNYFGDKMRVQALYDEVVQVVGSTEKLWLGLGSYIKSPEDIGAEMILCAGGNQAACFFSLGHFLSQRKSVQAYVDAVRKQHEGPKIARGAGRASLLATALEQVKHCLAAPDSATCADGDDALPQLIAEQGGRRQAAVQEKNRLWLDLRGIFRYVNPYDSLGKAEEQFELAGESYELLVKGQPFGEVARQYSQAGSRSYGGILPRRYLHTGSRVDEILADLEPGQVSPVISVHNGFWVYQLLAKGKL